MIHVNGAGFCDDQIPVLSTIGRGPKGPQGNQGPKGDTGFASFANPIEWDIDTDYPEYTIVLNDGNSYLSKVAVPNGVNITDENYWQSIGNYNAQVEQYRQEAAAAKATMDFLLENSVASDYGTEVFIGTEGNRATVYWAKIPKTYKPRLRLANGRVDTVQYEIDAAYDNKSAIQINAGIFDTSTAATSGPVILDGNVVKNAAYTEADRNFIAMDDNGTLMTFNGQNVSGEALKEMASPNWACIAFYSLIENGVFVATGRDNHDFEPRSIIAQDIDGNYCVMCCEGRKYDNDGMSLWDVRDFLTHINFAAQFAFNLDGGASASLCVNGIRVNGLVDDNHRRVANFISFEEEKPYNELFESNHVIANFLIANNKQDSALYASSYSQYVNAGANTARTLVQVDKSSTDFEYTPTMREAVETSTGLYRLLLKSAIDEDLVTALTLNPRYKVATLWDNLLITEQQVNYLSWNSQRVPDTTYTLENTTKSLKYLAVLQTYGGQNQVLQLYPYNFGTNGWPIDANFVTNNGLIGRIQFTFTDTTVQYSISYSDSSVHADHLCRLIGVRSL